MKKIFFIVSALLEIACYAGIFGNIEISQNLFVALSVISIINAFPLAFLLTDMLFPISDVLDSTKKEDDYTEKANSIFCDLIAANDEAQFQKAFENMIKFAKEPGTYNKCIYGDTLIKLRDFAPEVEQKVLEGLRNLKKD